MRLRHRKQREEAEIQFGPFADIAFLLIIFFILATELMKPMAEKVRIPSGKTDAQKTETENLTVNLKPGEIHYGKKAEVIKSIEVFRQRLADENFAKRSEQERTVVVEEDPATPYEWWYQVAMAIHESGGNLALVEYEEEKGQGGSGGQAPSGDQP